MEIPADRREEAGLKTHQPWQLPAYVTKVPDGSEKGQFLAVDLGGTNCRICLVDLHGDSTFTLVQTKHAVPASIRVNVSHKPLFRFIAGKLADFLGIHSRLSLGDTHKGEGFNTGRNSYYRLGFTFSFTCEQTSLAHGTLIHWDKGWDIPDAVGRDPCEMLQEATHELGLPVLVCVLANDSVGTLMTRAYTSRSEGSTLAGVIFGTGTNAAYVERLKDVKRIEAEPQLQKESPDGVMIINTEWGSFDDGMHVLPSTPYDNILDATSTEPGRQMLEKRVSGMYLGELLRLVLVRLVEAAAFGMVVDEGSPVFQRGGIDSSFLSRLAQEDNDSLDKTTQHITNTLGASNVTPTDCRAVRLVASAVVQRAARLAGASLAAIIIQSGRLEPSWTFSKSLDHSKAQPLRRSFITKLSAFFLSFTGYVRRLFKSTVADRVMKPSQSVDCPPPALESAGSSMDVDVIDIGVDGSLIEHYPDFEARMREAMREVPQIGPEGDRKITIGLAKDGSGVGAALMAQAAIAQDALR